MLKCFVKMIISGQNENEENEENDDDAKDFEMEPFIGRNRFEMFEQLIVASLDVHFNVLCCNSNSLDLFILLLNHLGNLIHD